MKYIPINGLKFTNSFALHWFGVNNRKIVLITKKLMALSPVCPSREIRNNIA